MSGLSLHIWSKSNILLHIFCQCQIYYYTLLSMSSLLLRIFCFHFTIRFGWYKTYFSNNVVVIMCIITIRCTDVMTLKAFATRFRLENTALFNEVWSYINICSIIRSHIVFWHCVLRKKYLKYHLTLTLYHKTNVKMNISLHSTL